jgi:ribulose-phosphate 3-epimerase
MKRHLIQCEPSLIAADWGRFAEEAELCVAAGSEILHLDVMDGHFVPNLTMGPDMVAAVKLAVPQAILDVHLMIYNPDRYIENFVKAGADEITFHIEATEEVEHTIQYIRTCNRSPGIAIRPETSEDILLPYLPLVDKVLVMTVEPGFGGQAFLPKMLSKVERLHKLARQHKLSFAIQVDGGITYETGKKCVEKGATRLVMGSDYFRQKDRKKAVAHYNELRNVAV